MGNMLTMSGWGEISTDNKTCTSYEQNSEHNQKADGACESDDKLLFQEPPPKLDCDICFLPMPFTKGVCGVTTSYMPCCGKKLCLGCIAASYEEMKKGNMKNGCPFCRLELHWSDKELLKRLDKRMKLNDVEAFYLMALYHNNGSYGLPKDYKKAVELWEKAAELGSVCAHASLAGAHHCGEGFAKDEEKGMHYMKLAAIGGHEHARYTLGIAEANNGNMDRAMKHLMIAARCGYEDSLKEVGEGYKAGHVTKDEYASTLRAYQSTLHGMKSEQRAKAETYEM